MTLMYSDLTECRLNHNDTNPTLYCITPEEHNEHNKGHEARSGDGETKITRSSIECAALTRRALERSPGVLPYSRRPPVSSKVHCPLLKSRT